LYFEALYLFEDGELVKRTYFSIVCPSTPTELQEFAEKITPHDQFQNCCNQPDEMYFEKYNKNNSVKDILYQVNKVAVYMLMTIYSYPIKNMREIEVRAKWCNYK
jgi:hypothetical protein